MRCQTLTGLSQPNLFHTQNIKTGQHVPAYLKVIFHCTGQVAFHFHQKTTWEEKMEVLIAGNNISIRSSRYQALNGFLIDIKGTESSSPCACLKIVHTTALKKHVEVKKRKKIYSLLK